MASWVLFSVEAWMCVCFVFLLDLILRLFVCCFTMMTYFEIAST
jgi:hypothetical protein